MRMQGLMVPFGTRRLDVSALDFDDVTDSITAKRSSEAVGHFGGMEVRASVFLPMSFIIAYDRNGERLGVIDLRARQA